MGETLSGDRLGLAEGLGACCVILCLRSRYLMTYDYTTNFIEWLHGCLRKIIKMRGSFPTALNVGLCSRRD